MIQKITYPKTKDKKNIYIYFQDGVRKSSVGRVDYQRTNQKYEN